MLYPDFCSFKQGLICIFFSLDFFFLVMVDVHGWLEGLASK